MKKSKPKPTSKPIPKITNESQGLANLKAAMLGRKRGKR